MKLEDYINKKDYIGILFRSGIKFKTIDEGVKYIADIGRRRWTQEEWDHFELLVRKHGNDRGAIARALGSDKTKVAVTAYRLQRLIAAGKRKSDPELDRVLRLKKYMKWESKEEKK